MPSLSALGRTLEGELFACRGCRKRRPRNPHLAAGVQQFCSAAACQRLRRTRWQRDRLRSDPAYKAAQRDADACWRENTAPNYHQEYRADLKKPVPQRRPRRQIRRPRSRRRQTLTVKLGAHELRVSVIPASAVSGKVDGRGIGEGDVELAVVRIRSLAEEDAVCGHGAKDGHVPLPENRTGSQI
mgnify:CR=1 FL=1